MRRRLARIATHLSGARRMTQARNALDAFGHATLAATLPSGRIVWQTALTRKLLGEYFPAGESELPPRIRAWLQESSLAARQGGMPRPLSVTQGTKKMILALHQQTGDGPEEEWLLVIREESDAAVAEALMIAFKLTQREAEVLYWVIKGKTNRDIGDILGTSPRTVNKHLEHVFEKLGVETRTAAAALAINRVRAADGG